MKILPTTGIMDPVLGAGSALPCVAPKQNQAEMESRHELVALNNEHKARLQVTAPGQKAG